MGILVKIKDIKECFVVSAYKMAFAHWPCYPVSNIISIPTFSVRRGYEVYKQVCSACHSMQYIAYRNLVGVTHTEAEAKAEAEQITVGIRIFRFLDINVS